MDSHPPFIKSIKINQVRHLRDIFIEIDESRPRHLILTGPNGCGKTSLLCYLKDHLQGILDQQVHQLDNIKQNIEAMEKYMDAQKIALARASTTEEESTLKYQILQTSNSHRSLKDIAERFGAITLDISDFVTLVESHKNGAFLISFFEAKRTAQIQPVTGAQKLDLPKVSPIATSATSLGACFLQFLVNQENRAALLQRKGDQAGVAEIDKWMGKITAKFRELFQNDELRLEYDIDNFDFTINIPGREPFRLVDNQLSDGFSAIIQIVAELLLRMEAVTTGDYNVPGIVLIDEIETHLHIKLQKMILPFLTDFFPRIQFIVTTHSPFVLTSLNEAVVFDLESGKRWEHLATIAASTVVESYFDLDLYSDEIKNRISRYQALAQKAGRTEQENAELEQLRAQLDGIDYESAPELVAHYRSLRAKESAL